MSRISVKEKIPSQYQRANWFDVIEPIETQLNLLSLNFQGMASAVPVNGSYVRGNWFQNSLPSPSGYFGFICTDSGSPGVWKGFGLIAA